MTLVGAVSMGTGVMIGAGIIVFSLGGLWVAGFSFENTSENIADTSIMGFIAAMALVILAYKGFTTITNSGSEIIDPHQNVGRAIMISIVICVVIYFLGSSSI